MKTVLVVDDDKINLNTALKILGGTYKVVPVPSAKVAFTFLERNKPDIILLDIIMPDMDGFEFMEEFNKMEEFKDVPVVCLSADERTETVERAKELGVASFLSKPLESQKLKDKVEEFIGK